MIRTCTCGARRRFRFALGHTGTDDATGARSTAGADIVPTSSARRRLLGLAAWSALPASAVLGGLSGCDRTGNDASKTAAVDFGPSTACELDGMLLAEYPGPKAQILFAGASGPEFFCDTVEMFNTLLRPEQVRAVKGAWVQDMAQADWELPRGHWTDARSAFYVRGSRRHGSMGPTLASFAQQADAERFAAQHGGSVLRYADVTPEMVDLSGGAKVDQRM